MILRICTEPGCDAIADGPRCPNHIRSRDKVRTATRGTTYSDREWRRIRLLVLARDDYRCQLRGRRCTGDATAVDHIIPLSKGGSRLDPRNLRASCSWCNTSRGSRPDHMD